MSNDMALQAKAEPPREARGIVVSTDDPRRLMRVQVRVPSLWDGVQDADLPWAEYLLKSARVRGGDFEPAEVGDWVWVDFPSGDTRYPRITGWCHYAPDGAPNLPHEAFAGADSYEHKRLANQPAPEPAEYHRSRVLTKHGVTVEIDPSGACRVTQRETGSAIEISKDGHIVIHGENKNYISSASDTECDIGRNLIVRISGDAKVRIDGNAEVKISGFAQIISSGAMLIKSLKRLVLKGPSRTLTL